MPYPSDPSEERSALTFLLLAFIAVGALFVRRRPREVPRD